MLQQGAREEVAAAKVGSSRALLESDVAPAPLEFSAFADECDRARDARTIGALLLRAAQALGFERFALVTHGGAGDFGALAVSMHHGAELIARQADERRRALKSPLLKAAESSDQTIHWNAPAFRARLDAQGRAWMKEACAAGMREGLSQRIGASLLPASLSVAPGRGEGDGGMFRHILRLAAYAFYQVQALQRPRLAAADVLTEREHEFLTLAIWEGLRPQGVAQAMGVSVNTVRTLRQSACARLGARTPEEVVWRLIETGQLFSGGRATRLRDREQRRPA